MWAAGEKEIERAEKENRRKVQKLERKRVGEIRRKERGEKSGSWREGNRRRLYERKDEKKGIKEEGNIGIELNEGMERWKREGKEERVEKRRGRERRKTTPGG